MTSARVAELQQDTGSHKNDWDADHSMIQLARNQTSVLTSQMRHHHPLDQLDRS